MPSATTTSPRFAPASRTASTTALDSSHIKELLERNALAQETMSVERLFAVKEQMEMAEARRLQPYFVRSFFTKAFEGLGGAMYPREPGRWEITHVPALIRERDRQITGRKPPRTRPRPETLRARLFHQGSRPSARQAGHSLRPDDPPRSPAHARRQ